MSVPDLVVARLADRQHRVQVDVRVHERRRQEAALRVQLASRLALERAGRPDGFDTIAGDRHVHEFRSGPPGNGSIGMRGVEAGVAHDEIHARLLPIRSPLVRRGTHAAAAPAV